MREPLSPATNYWILSKKYGTGYINVMEGHISVLANVALARKFNSKQEAEEWAKLVYIKDVEAKELLPAMAALR